jgi:SAM-dependent methyltransferase
MPTVSSAAPSAFANRYALVYDLLHGGKSYSKEIEDVLAMIKRSGFDQPQCAIDMASGTGQHAKALVDKGLFVHANDLSASMIEAARERFSSIDTKKYFLSVSPMQNVEMSSVAKTKGGYDLATAFYTTVGYLVDPNDLHTFFLNLRKILKPGGLFFADFWNGQKMSTQYSPSRERIAENDHIKVLRKSVNKHLPTANALEVTFDFDLTYKASGQREQFSEKHLVRYHFVPEIVSLLKAYDFKIMLTAPFFEDAPSAVEAWNFCVLAVRN